MSNDVRIITSLPTNPKTLKLIKRLGQASAWNLIRLFLFVGDNKPSGDLSGLTSEDIEIASDWLGENGQFVSTLVEIRFLDETPDGYKVHDWAIHNPWASGHELRSVKARWNAIKRHHGDAEADRQVPEYRASSNASSITIAVRTLDSSNAPSPSPSPSPKAEGALPAESPAPNPKKGTRLPADWLPSNDLLSWARQKRPDLNLDETLERFRDFWTAKPGSGGVKLDWDATYRNWVRSETVKPFAKPEPVRPLPTKPLPETPEQAAKRKADEQAAWRSQMERMGVAV